MSRSKWRPTVDFGGRRFPTIIEGVLELMPMGPPWDAAEYEEWIALFDHACRIYYRLERPATARSAVSADPDSLTDGSLALDPRSE